MPKLIYTAFAIAALLVANSAWCQSGTFPVRPIRMVVGFTPGGQPDITARMLAPKLYEAFGQQVIVDNRPGAGGTLGTEIAARAPADGHTLLVVSQPFAVNQSLFAKLPYDTLRDFTPVILAATSANAMSVHPGVPATSVKALVALAKAKPRQLTYASSGNGTSPHMSMALLSSMTGVEFVHEIGRAHV